MGLLDEMDLTKDLSDADMVAALTGGTVQGDTAVVQAEGNPTPEVAPEAPVPEAAPAPAPEPVVVETDPVVLAKDGRHTIPFSQLEEARAQAAHWESIAKANQALAESLKQTPAAPVETAPTDGPSLADEYPEVAGEIEKLVTERLAPLQKQVADQLASLQKTREDAVNVAHFGAIRSAHPDFDALVADRPKLDAWVASLPPLARPGYELALSQGTTQQVIELFNDYKASLPKAPVAAPAAAPAPPKSAAEVLAGVKPAKPSSLSEVPAGSAAHHDVTTAMMEMTSRDLMAQFTGKSFEQVQELVGRLT